MLFGDCAGAVVLTAAGGPSRIGPVATHSDPSGSGLIRLARDGALIRMDGPGVYRRAVTLLAQVTREAVGLAGRVLLATFGAGLVWGGAVVEWGGA
jgi:3-oxoacyl-[acyl-carrier-protein] synthase III